MKIGILTRRAGFNMGSSLQAFAMARFIADAGYNCQIIDYDEYSGHPLWKVRPMVEDLQWGLLKHVPRLSGKYAYLLARNQQYGRFNAFEEKYLPLTPTTYRNRRQLATLAAEYDVLVCGSDQIWSPLLYDPVFFINFLPAGCSIRTVAYAPSLGIDNAALVGEEQAALMRKINHISCREQQGAQIIESITGRKVPVVLDPTLMVDPAVWNSLTAPVEQLEGERYILCYFLGSNVHQSYIDRLKDKLGCKVVNLQMFNRMNSLQADLQLSDIGPNEFLTLVKMAQWVCTDSFHATIFSYIFGRQVSVFERFKSTDRQNQNSRIHTLLEILGLHSSLVKDNEVLIPQASNPKNNLSNWKLQSLEFLHNSLK